MKQILNFNTKFPEDKFYFNYLKLISGALNITNKEIIVLSEIFEIENKNKEFDIEEETISSSNRIILRERLGMSEHNLNNYIKALKDKKLLIPTGDSTLKINPKIFISKQDICIKFNITI